MNLYRKLTVSSLAVMAVGAAAAASLSLSQVNQKVADLLAPFNNESTVLQVRFTALDVDQTRTLDFGVKGLLDKTGKFNHLTLKVKNIDYAYKGEDGVPTVSGSASVDLDFLKVYDQKELNDWATGAADLVNQFLAETTKEYGAAASVDAAIDSLKKDKNGDVVSLKLHLKGEVDLSKLPAGLQSEEVPVLGGEGHAQFDRMGGKLSFSARLNPAYKGFKSDHDGLKETIEKFLAGDAKTYDDLGQLAGMLNYGADYLVNKDKNAKP